MMINAKKYFEQEIGSFFAHWLNKKYKLDYICTSNKKQDSIADLYLESKKFKKYSIQVTNAEGVSRKWAMENTKRFNAGDHTIAYDMDLIKLINEALQKKEDRYGPIEKKSTILL
ncbi:MAG TPA: hypothetical protein ENH35_04400, partial [Candidatus Moranbacteria bacterium]|nr:hypothetical protein [Candidatus Moranbacteria bacterium]